MNAIVRGNLINNLVSLAVMPVNKRSVARGTGDMVVNKLGKALVEDGLARGELRVPLQ